VDKTYPLNSQPPEAIAVYCSDPRFKDATERFIREELKLQNFAAVVVPGSIGHLMFQFIKPKSFKFLKEQLELLAQNNPNVKRIVLINHEDCKWYHEVGATLHHILASEKLADVQKSDLKAVIRILHDILKPKVDIEVYFAALQPDKTIKFDKIV
jgi:hypothetical protein